MVTTIAMLHTGAVVIEPLNALAKRILPEVHIVNLLDDSIVPELERSGQLTAEVRRRVLRLGLSAKDGGADGVLVTCSSISMLADTLSEFTGLPVYKIDEAMAEAAIDRGPRIGVVATLPTTLEPTSSLIESIACSRGEEVAVSRELCREAFEALRRGSPQEHDAMVLSAVGRLALNHDVVVLAQASMGRLADRVSGYGVPVLTSPELGLRQVREKMAHA